MQIIPIKELKNTMKISEMCHQSQEPIYITKNGYGDMVLMSIEFFVEMNQRTQLYRELAVSERQFEEGKMKKAYSALSDVRAKYGL